MATSALTQATAPAFRFTGFIHEGVPAATENLAAYTDMLGLKLRPHSEALDDLGPAAWLGDDDNTLQFHLIANDKTLRPAGDARAEPSGRHTSWRNPRRRCFSGTHAGARHSVQGDLEPGRRSAVVRHRPGRPHLGISGSCCLGPL